MQLKPTISRLLTKMQRSGPEIEVPYEVEISTIPVPAGYDSACNSLTVVMDKTPGESCGQNYVDSKDGYLTGPSGLFMVRAHRQIISRFQDQGYEVVGKHEIFREAA